MKRNGIIFIVKNEFFRTGQNKSGRHPFDDAILEHVTDGYNAFSVTDQRFRPENEGKPQRLPCVEPKAVRRPRNFADESSGGSRCIRGSASTHYCDQPPAAARALGAVGPIVTNRL